LFGKGKSKMDKSKIDPQDMFGAIYRFTDQIKEAITIGEHFNLRNDYSSCTNIVVAGMGGSAIGGDIVKTIAQNELTVPFYINRNY